MQRRHIEVVCIFVASLLLFTLGLIHQDIIGFDSRFYVFANEMCRNGLSWFPTTYQVPYPDYPGTSTWLICLTALLGGGLNKFTAVFPSAVMAAVVVVLTFLIGEAKRSRWGWYAIAFLLMTAEFLRCARSISLDVYITAITTGCFYLLTLRDSQLSRKESYPFKVIPKIWLYVLITLGFMLRGPIGLVIPTSVICTYYVIGRKFRECVVTGMIAAVILVIGTGLLLLTAYAVGGVELIHNVIKMEVAGRLTTDYLPKYYYFTTAVTTYAVAYPFAVLSAICAIGYSITRRNRHTIPLTVFQLLGWVIIIMVGLSIPGDKKIRYILPITPAISLLAAYPFVASNSKAAFAFVRHAATLFFLMLPGILMFGLLYVRGELPASIWNVSSHYYSMLMCLAFIQFGSIVAWSRFKTAPRLILFALTAFLTVYMYMYEPVTLNVERADKFVQHVELLRHVNKQPLIFYHESEDGLVIKYVAHMHENIKPIFLQHPADLEDLAERSVIIARAVEFKRLPATISDNYDVLVADKMGHVDMVAFRKKV